MLRTYFVQQWFGLSDEGVEDAITDSQSVRAFVGVGPGRGRRRTQRPCCSTALLGAHDLTRQLFAGSQCRATGTGTVDA
jgi:IS5 family transposase